MSTTPEDISFKIKLSQLEEEYMKKLAHQAIELALDDLNQYEFSSVDTLNVWVLSSDLEHNLNKYFRQLVAETEIRKESVNNYSFLFAIQLDKDKLVWNIVIQLETYYMTIAFQKNYELPVRLAIPKSKAKRTWVETDGKLKKDWAW
jgi:hypothetical protein